MTQPRTLGVERASAQRADFVVYYTRNGKRYLDGIYGPDADAARATFLGLAAELGWKVEVDRVERRDPEYAIGDVVNAFHPRTLGVVKQGRITRPRPSNREYVTVDFGELNGGKFRVAMRHIVEVVERKPEATDA